MVFNWKEIDGTEKSVLIKRANDLHDHPFFADDNTDVYISVLPFYERIQLLELRGGFGRMRKKMQFLFNDELIIKVNGDQASIYDANIAGGVKLNLENAFDYTKFFVESLATEGGEFKIIEKFEDVKFTNEPSKEIIEKLPLLIKKADVKELDDHYKLVFCVFYDNNLFETTAVLKKDGNLQLVKEDLLLEDVPTKNILYM
ncbi:MAG: hypothetical protein AB7U85_02790 [Alphaproteobacteria bacterium]